MDPTNTDILAAVLVLSAVFSLFAVAALALAAIVHRKPYVRLFGRDTFYNPFNILLAPDMLTDKGRRYWRQMLWALLLYFILFGITFIYLSLKYHFNVL